MKNHFINLSHYYELCVKYELELSDIDLNNLKKLHDFINEYTVRKITPDKCFTDSFYEFIQYCNEKKKSFFHYNEAEKIWHKLFPMIPETEIC